MKNKYVFVSVMLCCVLIAGVVFTAIAGEKTQHRGEENQIRIVTSFYPMYIAALNITDGVDDVVLENLSEPQTGCLHDFQLTPEDMKLLSGADIFIINGGGIEDFMTQVADSYPKLQVVEACEKVRLLPINGESSESHTHSEVEEAYAHEEEDETHVHEEEDETHVHEEEDETHAHEEEDETHTHVHAHDDVNAHAWMCIEDYRTMVKTIAEKLGSYDKAHAERYIANMKKYDGKLAKIQERQDELASKVSQQHIIVFHEAYAYVAQDLGLEVVATLDLDEERQVSAGEISDVLHHIEEDDVSYILAEELYGKSMGDTVMKESQVQVLYIDPLTRGNYEKDAYIEGMERNLDILEQMAD